MEREFLFYRIKRGNVCGFSLMWKVNGKNKWTNERMWNFSLSQDLYIPVDNICLFEQLFHRKKSMGTPEMT